jgi:histone H3/H4
MVRIVHDADAAVARADAPAKKLGGPASKMPRSALAASSAAAPVPRATQGGKSPFSLNQQSKLVARSKLVAVRRPNPIDRKNAKPDAVGAARKKRRMKSGQAAVKEIKKLQDRIEPQIKRTPFARVVRDEMHNASTTGDLRITASAMEALREATEHVIVELFTEANRVSLHAGRRELMARDWRFVLRTFKNLHIKWASSGQSQPEIFKARNGEQIVQLNGHENITNYMKAKMLLKQQLKAARKRRVKKAAPVAAGDQEDAPADEQEEGEEEEGEENSAPADEDAADE